MSPLIVQPPKSRVILGLMTFGPDETAGARITDMGEYNRVLDLFQSRGYNEIDTARIYIGGKQEAFTREAKWKDRGLTLATKIKYPTQSGENASDKVFESMELSLRELGTDCVDILYLHAALCFFFFFLFFFPPDIFLSSCPCSGKHGTRQQGKANAIPPRIAALLLRRPSRPSTSSTGRASLSASDSATLPRSRWPRWS